MSRPITDEERRIVRYHLWMTSQSRPGNVDIPRWVLAGYEALLESLGHPVKGPPLEFGDESSRPEDDGGAR